MKRTLAILASIVTLFTLAAVPAEAAYTSRGYANRVSAGRPDIRALRAAARAGNMHRQNIAIRRAGFNAPIAYHLGSLPSRLAVTGGGDSGHADYLPAIRPSRRTIKTFRLESNCGDENLHGRVRYNNRRLISRCEQEFE